MKEYQIPEIKIETKFDIHMFPRFARSDYELSICCPSRAYEVNLPKRVYIIVVGMEGMNIIQINTNENIWLDRESNSGPLYN